MAFFIIVAAAAAQAASSHHVDPDAARAAGFAEAQAALAGTEQTPTINPTAASPVPPAGPAPSTVVNAVAPGSGGQMPLFLTCAGAGTADKQRMGFAIGAWGSWATAVSHHDRQFADQVDIRLFSGDDRIRIPRTMLPELHGGQGGWFKLKDVVADARSIQAHAAVAAFHNPKIYIDRVTGTISISGKSGDYSGQCQAMDPNAVARF